MKVLFHIPFEAIGGAELQIKYLLGGFSSDIHPFVTYRSQAAEVFVKSLGVPSKQVLSPHSLARVLDELRPDVVQYYHSKTVYGALKKLSWRPKTCEIIHNRAHFPNDSTGYPKDLTDCVVCVSPDAQSYFLSKFPGTTTTLIPNGVDTSVFKPKKSLSGKRSRLLGGFAGRLEKGNGKGIPKIIEFISQLPVDFELVGTDYGNYYLQYLEKHGITNIQVRPFSSDIEEKYQSWDFFVSASPKEGFGLAIAEALSCGLPSVIWNCGGICHYLEHKKHTWLAETDEEFLEGLRLLVEEKLELKPTDVDFSAKKMAGEYEALYKKLLSQEVM